MKQKEITSIEQLGFELTKDLMKYKEKLEKGEGSDDYDDVEYVRNENAKPIFSSEEVKAGHEIFRRQLGCLNNINEFTRVLVETFGSNLSLNDDGGLIVNSMELSPTMDNYTRKFYSTLLLFVKMLGEYETYLMDIMSNPMKYTHDKNLEYNNFVYNTVIREWELRVLRTICEEIINTKDYDEILDDNNSDFDNEIMEEIANVINVLNNYNTFDEGDKDE